MNVGKDYGLIKITLEELAEFIDDMPLNITTAFATIKDTAFLREFDLTPLPAHVVLKTDILYEEYSIVFSQIGVNSTTVAKDIEILSENNVDNKEARVKGILNFLTEYYEKYMEKYELYMIIFND